MNLNAAEQQIISMMKHIGQQAEYLRGAILRIEIPEDETLSTLKMEIGNSLIDVSDSAANTIARVEQLAQDRED